MTLEALDIVSRDQGMLISFALMETPQVLTSVALPKDSEPVISSKLFCFPIIREIQGLYGMSTLFDPKTGASVKGESFCPGMKISLNYILGIYLGVL